MKRPASFQSVERKEYRWCLGWGRSKAYGYEVDLETMTIDTKLKPKLRPIVKNKAQSRDRDQLLKARGEAEDEVTTITQRIRSQNERRRPE